MEIIILRGLPGSGKSTYARRNFPGALVCSADDYFVRDGVYAWVPRKNSEAHGQCFRKFSEGIKSKVSQIVVSNTNTRLWEMERYINAGIASEYQITVIRLRCDVRSSVHRNTHHVPVEKIVEMRDRFEYYGGELVV